MAIRDIEKLIEEESDRLRTLLAVMNRQKVAEEVGLHRNTVYGFVKGNDVSFPILKRISEYLDGVSA